MTPKDVASLVTLVVGSLLVAILIILIKQGKIKLEMWPPILGIGAGLYMFISSMVFSILLGPISEITHFTITNTLWSFVVGTIGYISGRRIVRRTQNKK